MADMYPITADWFEHDTDETSASVSSAGRSLEVGKSHFLCGICASCDMGTAVPPETVEVRIYHGPLFGAVNILQFAFVSATQYKDTTTNASYAASTGGPLIHSFPTPIKIPEGRAITMTVGPVGTGTAVQIYATIWGFTR